MPTASAKTSETVLSLTPEEREQLTDVINEALRSKQLEVHRTESFAFRDRVQREQEVLECIAQKLRP